MHDKFKIRGRDIPFSSEEKEFRICAMQEELDEYRQADTPEEELDALVDLVVFTLGTAERQQRLHIFYAAFCRVMEANMKKELGANMKRGSFHIDLIKPKNWIAPDHSSLFLISEKEDDNYDRTD